MGIGDYLQGLMLLALVLGAGIFAATRIAAAHVPDLRGVVWLLAVALLATAVVLAVHLIPAAFGILDRLTVAALAILVIAGSSRLAPRRRSAPDQDPPPESRLSALLPALAVAALATYMLALLSRSYATPLINIDTVSFHLPGVARWLQSDSIWQIDQFLPGQAQGYYPGNGNLVELAAVLPWNSDFLIRFVNLPFFAIAGLAVFAMGRELGAPRSSAAVAAAAAISVPAMIRYVVDSPTPDAVMYASFATGVLFLLRHSRTGERGDLLLAGLGLGIAFGTRWYGVSSVAVVVFVWLGARLLARRPRLALDAAWLGATIAIGGGIWLLRNLVEVGNPVFPVEVSLLGDTLFSAPRDVVRELVGSTVADYLDDRDVLSTYVLPGLKLELGYVGAALGAGTVAAVAIAARRPGPARARVLALAAAGFGLAVAYAITPYTALGLEGRPLELTSNVRYLVPALLVAAPAVAWALGRAGRARPLLEAVLVLCALDAIRRGVDVSAGDLLAGVALALAACACAYAIARALRAGGAGALAAGALAALALAVGLYAVQERFLDDRYAGAGPALDAALAQSPPANRIGLAGAWPVTTLSPVLALFGPELDNEVAYVGESRDGMLLPYQRREPFADALEHGRYDLLMVGNAPPLGFAQHDEARWAEQAGYRTVAADANFTLLAP